MSKRIVRIVVSLILLCLITPMFTENTGLRLREVYADEIKKEYMEVLPIVSEETVKIRIDELCKAMEINNFSFDSLAKEKGRTFTVDEQKCKLVNNKEGNCDNCSIKEIINEAKWIKKCGIVIPTNPSMQLPGHYKMEGNRDKEGLSTRCGYTCYGFANFALWYIYKADADSIVEPILISKEYSFTTDDLRRASSADNGKSIIRTGDIVRFLEKGHSAIFLDYVKNGDDIVGMWVLDSNMYGKSRSVDVHQILVTDKGTSGVWEGNGLKITRATNYQPYCEMSEESEQTDKDSMVNYYHYTDGNGKYSYCGQKIDGGFLNSIYSFFKGIKVSKEERNYKESELTKQRDISHKNHWLSNKCDIADCEVIEYVDKDGILWYLVDNAEAVSSKDLITSLGKNCDDETENSSSDIVLETDQEESSDVLSDSIENGENIEDTVDKLGFVPWREAGIEDHTMVWGDDVLEKLMREETGIYDRPIMLSDVWEIECLYLNNSPLDNPLIDSDEFGQIKNISALGELQNLTSLDLNWSSISDISALCKLVNLNSLGLNGCPISDFSGISKMKNLNHLELAQTGISDISILRELTSLEYLDLGINNINDISVLANLPKLYYLNLYNNQITDVSPLNVFKDMYFVDITGNPITNLSSVSFLSNQTCYHNSNYYFLLISIDSILKQAQNDIYDYYNSNSWTRDMLTGAEDIAIQEIDTSYLDSTYSGNILCYFLIWGMEGEGVALYKYRSDLNNWKLESVHFE